MIHKAYYTSPIGVLEIIASQKGIKEIYFRDKMNETLAPLGGNPHLQLCVKELDEYFTGARKKFNVSLDMTGTEFQKLVWKQLQMIPYGQTISYLVLAKKLDNQAAVRAVASANGKNKIPVIIPCHRVIGKNGNLVGYAGGLDKKAYLLELEKALINQQLSIF